MIKGISHLHTHSPSQQRRLLWWERTVRWLNHHTPAAYLPYPITFKHQTTKPCNNTPEKVILQSKWLFYFEKMHLNYISQFLLCIHFNICWNITAFIKVTGFTLRHHYIRLLLKVMLVKREFIADFLKKTFLTFLTLL